MASRQCLIDRLTIDWTNKSIDELANLLYNIRSQFMHRAMLVLEFSKGTMLSHRKGKRVVSSISIESLGLLFEDGLLKHFGFRPDRRPCQSVGDPLPPSLQ